MVPFEVLPANRIEYLRKTSPRPFIYRQLNLLFDFGIIIKPGLIVKTTASDISCIAGSFNRQAFLVCLPGKIFSTGRR
jgi:hypothetical protein